MVKIEDSRLLSEQKFAHMTIIVNTINYGTKKY